MSWRALLLQSVCLARRWRAARTPPHIRRNAATPRRPGTRLAAASPVLHGDALHGPMEALHAWSFEPGVVAALAATAFAYGRGRAELHARAPRASSMATWRARCFWAGVAALALALLSPVDSLGATLFAAHMVQHLLLVLVAAPLLVLGDAGTFMLW